MSATRDRLRQMSKTLAARVNLDIHRRDLAHPARRMAAMRHRDVDLVLDVGANRGQYAHLLREHGYAGRIVSFEPIPAMFDAITSARAGDPLWAGHQVAAGAFDGLLTFHVSRDTVTSSALDPDRALLEQIPTASTAETISVPSRRLDTMWSTLTSGDDRIMVKIDVQGFEHSVLDGLGACLDDVVLVEIEMGLAGLYSGGASIHDLLPRLHDAEFKVVSVDSGFVAPATGQVLDMDVLMGRT